MPRPRMNDDVAVNETPSMIDESISNHANANADTANVDTEAVTTTDNGKKPRGGKRLKVADGTLGLLDEPVPAEVPKRGGGRGRTVSPQTLRTIELLKANPGQSYKIGRYAAAAVADGVWKENNISFSSSAVEITNVDGDPVTVFDRYAVYNPPVEEAGDAGDAG